jgi:hypothetical protein
MGKLRVLERDPFLVEDPVDGGCGDAVAHRERSGASVVVGVRVYDRDSILIGERLESGTAAAMEPRDDDRGVIAAGCRHLFRLDCHVSSPRPSEADRTDWQSLREHSVSAQRAGGSDHDGNPDLQYWRSGAPRQR